MESSRALAAAEEAAQAAALGPGQPDLPLPFSSLRSEARKGWKVPRPDSKRAGRWHRHIVLRASSGGDDAWLETRGRVARRYRKLLRPECPHSRLAGSKQRRELP